jgi:hypothetical protein
MLPGYYCGYYIIELKYIGEERERKRESVTAPQ